MCQVGVCMSCARICSMHMCGVCVCVSLHTSHKRKKRGRGRGRREYKREERKEQIC